MPAAEEASWSLSLNTYLARIGTMKLKTHYAPRKKHRLEDQMDTTESHFATA